MTLAVVTGLVLLFTTFVLFIWPTDVTTWWISSDGWVITLCFDCDLCLLLVFVISEDVTIFVLDTTFELVFIRSLWLDFDAIDVVVAELLLLLGLSKLIKVVAASLSCNGVVVLNTISVADNEQNGDGIVFVNLIFGEGNEGLLFLLE